MNNEERSGYKKCEFWTAVFAMLLIFTAQMLGRNSLDFTAAITAIASLYITGRSVVKSVLANGTTTLVETPCSPKEVNP